LSGAIAWTAFAVGDSARRAWRPSRQRPSIRHHHWQPQSPVSPTDPDKDAALVVDGLTGKSCMSAMPMPCAILPP
jgi:hypothetical protein